MKLSSLLSSGNVDIIVTAGEYVAANDCVYIAAYGTSGKTAGNAYRTDATSPTSSSNSFVAGFALAPISSGTSGKVRIAGSIGRFVGLTAGLPYYCDTTPGLITPTKPSYPRIVGLAISETEIILNVRGSNTIIYTGVTGTYGYYAGGVTTSTAQVVTTDKVTFSTDVTAAQASANLTGNKGMSAGISQSGIKGYFSGGYTVQTTTDKVTFSTATTSAATTANLSQGRNLLGSLSESTSSGYFLGGRTTTGSTARVATADKTTYSTDSTVAMTTANLSLARWAALGVNGEGTKGYIGGGATSPVTNSTEKTVYSTDTTAAQTSANLSQARTGACGLSNGSTKGYFCGGNNGADVATVDKITYATDTTAASGSNLGIVRNYAVGITEGSNKGYTCGGVSTVTRTEKMTYATDVSADTATAYLSQGRWGGGTCSDTGW